MYFSAGDRIEDYINTGPLDRLMPNGAKPLLERMQTKIIYVLPCHQGKRGVNYIL